MDAVPLNKAHVLKRRADALLHQKKFSECIIAHQEAADCLKEALLQITYPLSIESVNLQREYHLKQIEGLKMKRIQYEQSKSNHEFIKSRLDFDDLDPSDEMHLETMIFRTMDCHDSLVELLIKRGQSDNVDNGDEDEGEDVCDGMKSLSIKKHKVDDSTIIEEFKVLSEKLRESVQCLVDLLEEKNKEIDKLKAQICSLETDKNKGKEKKSDNLNVNTDSSGGTSPYVFSPCSELSPEINEFHNLPPLPPLGLPNFDFDKLTKPQK